MTTTELTGAEDVAWDLSDLYESGDDARLEQDVQEAEEARRTWPIPRAARSSRA